MTYSHLFFLINYRFQQNAVFNASNNKSKVVPLKELHVRLPVECAFNVFAFSFSSLSIKNVYNTKLFCLLIKIYLTNL